MGLVKKIIGYGLIAGLALSVSVHYIAQHIDKQPTELIYELKADEFKKKIIKEHLEEDGYTVLLVKTEFASGTRDLVGIGMYSKSSREEIVKQLGDGFAALYGAWPDKELYIVSLSDEIDICHFTQFGDMIRAYVNGKVSSSDYNSFIKKDCEPVKSFK